MDQTNDISVSGETEDLEQQGNRAAETLHSALIFLKKKDIHLDLFLFTPSLMEALNKKSREKEGPTTVLSFPDPGTFPHPEVEKKHIGEIYLCPQEISERGESLDRFAIHGLLHLLGYTHDKKRDTMNMEQAEAEILSFLE